MRRQSARFRIPMSMLRIRWGVPLGRDLRRGVWRSCVMRWARIGFVPPEAGISKSSRGTNLFRIVWRCLLGLLMFGYLV